MCHTERSKQQVRVGPIIIIIIIIIIIRSG